MNPWDKLSQDEQRDFPYSPVANTNFLPRRPGGTDVMILKIFSPKNLANILVVFAQTTATFCKNCDHNIGF
jgi:hypothetical protein